MKPSTIIYQIIILVVGTAIILHCLINGFLKFASLTLLAMYGIDNLIEWVLE